MMTNANGRVYTEAEIEAEFGEAYNQIKDEDDSREYAQPFRYLTQWYLKELKDGDDVRLALPDSGRFSELNKHHVICGLLESRDGNAPLSFELRQPVYWCVDRKPSKRGIWVPTTNVWYWLKQPDAKQEDVNVPLRAKLGLMSNILDVFMEERNNMPYFYASAHLQMSPEAVHERLSCSDDSVYARYNDPSLPVYKTPWDMDLFRNALPFLKKELRRAVCTGWEKSEFWKALRKMKPAKTKWTPAKYLESAKLAERRSQQQPWGEPLANPKPIRLNWILESGIQDNDMDIENSEQQLSQDRLAAHVDESDDDNVKSKKKPLSAKRRNIHDSSNDDHYGAKKRNKKQRNGLEEKDGKQLARKKENDGVKEDEAMTPAEKAKYTPKRMVQALNRLKDFLEPTPSSDESGKWEDVQDKFALGDVKTAADDKNKASADEKTAVDLVTEMRSDEQFSDECKLLTILAFKNACSNGKFNVAKKLFPKKGKAGASILEQWRQDAVNTLKQLAPRHNTTEDWYSEMCVYKLVNAHMTFIRSCSFIKNKESLDMLKEKLSLDWNQGTYFDDIEQFGRKFSIRALLTECVWTKSHLQKMMEVKNKVEEHKMMEVKKKVEEQQENDATAREDAASKEKKVQAGNEEVEGSKTRMATMLAEKGVAMADPQPGLQSAGQQPTSKDTFVSPSPSSEDSAPTNLPIQEISRDNLTWTRATPAYLLPWEPQSGEEEGQLTAGVSGGSFGRQLVPDDQFSRRDHRPTNGDRGSEMGYRPGAINDRRSDSTGRRHQTNDRRYQHSDIQFRANDRAPERIDSRSRENGRGSDRSIGSSLEFNRGSEGSESRPNRGYEHTTDRSRQYDERSQHRPRDWSRGSEDIQSRSRHSSEDDRPRSNGQVDDRPYRGPAFDTIPSTRGRGRGLAMTLPAWKTRQDP